MLVLSSCMGCHKLMLCSTKSDLSRLHVIISQMIDRTLDNHCCEYFKSSLNISLQTNFVASPFLQKKNPSSTQDYVRRFLVRFKLNIK
jgi:hypothetical protein